MAYDRYQPPRRHGNRLFKNEEIRAEKVLVVDNNGESLGELSLEEGIQQARDRELDLVLVAPKAKPPVCRIADWSKLQYERSKKEKQGGAKSPSVKGMRLTPYIGDGDFAHKLKRSREFLAKKHPVKFTIFVKGRVTKDILFALMNRVIEEMKDEVEMEGGPKFEGRNLSLLVFPKKK